MRLVPLLTAPLFTIQDYIAVKEKYAKYLPHSAGRYAAKRFRKAQCPIVERLTNSMMMHGRNNGKKLMTVRIVKHAFEIIHLLTGEVRFCPWFIPKLHGIHARFITCDTATLFRVEEVEGGYQAHAAAPPPLFCQNPLQVLVNAIINSGPREDSTRIGRAGTVRRQAVDVSPLRRVNQVGQRLVKGWGRSHQHEWVGSCLACFTRNLTSSRKPSWISTLYGADGSPAFPVWFISSLVCVLQQVLFCFFIHL